MKFAAEVRPQPTLPMSDHASLIRLPADLADDLHRAHAIHDINVNECNEFDYLRAIRARYIGFRTSTIRAARFG